MPRYLTKSRFKLASQCPTKLYYTGKREEYADRSEDDSFLKVLADGGFQVGELAKLYFPGGVDVVELDHAKALAETEELLQREEVVIFEAAIAFEKLFIRVDVLEKKGDQVRLIEVKAKSCKGRGAGEFVTKKGKPKSDWRPYLEDAAFQKYVLEQAHPEFAVRAYLMLVDKSSTCPGDGLHQKFRIDMNERGRSFVTVTAPLTQEELDQPILCQVDVDEIADGILAAADYGEDGALPFADWLRQLSDRYAADEKIHTEIGGKCGNCEFQASSGDKAQGLKSGFEECWRTRLSWTDEHFEVPTILELGGLSAKKKREFLAEGRGSLRDIEASDLDLDGGSAATLSTAERRWLQVQAAKSGGADHTLRHDALRREMEGWVYPLHFIDFETAAPAIPLHEGQRPYETLVFQFSHHVMYEDGRVEHRGEYINTELGGFPNFEFLRALRDELGGDEGSIFRYSHHENTVLSAVHGQLGSFGEGDAAELMEFIESIARPTAGGTQWRRPERDMIDLCELVKKYYFDPAMGGSVSIKKVLPAVLNGSDFLKGKYSEPVYGQEGGILSRNFVEKVWVEYGDGGVVRDPYELLPTLFREEGLAAEERRLSSSDVIDEGAAAMAAYTRMQFGEMLEGERGELEKGLLRYCELDSLAMVMVYEAWREWCLA